MTGAQLSGQKHPYLYTAKQNPDGTWTINASRFTGDRRTDAGSRLWWTAGHTGVWLPVHHDWRPGGGGRRGGGGSGGGRVGAGGGCGPCAGGGRFRDSRSWGLPRLGGGGRG